MDCGGVWVCWRVGSATDSEVRGIVSEVRRCEEAGGRSVHLCLTGRWCSVDIRVCGVDINGGGRVFLGTPRVMLTGEMSAYF